MLLPEPDGPTMNVHDPAGTRNVTPRSASTTSSPLRNDLRTSTASIIGWLLRHRSTARLRRFRSRHVTLCRIASIGVIRDAFHAG